MKITDLKKEYPVKNGASVTALSGVSFELPEKGMVFLLGKSGSGKTTLLNVLSGLDSFDEGCVEVNGKNLKDFSAKELENYRNHTCGIVFQDYNLLPELSVGENIALSLELRGEKNTGEKVKEVLNQVELSGYENRKVKELSGGQKQRVAIARAIAKNPEIVFADEPTGALDEETGKGILALLKELSKDRLVVVVSHDEEFAREYGDRIIELSDGKIVSDSAPLSDSSSEEKPLEVGKTHLPFRSALKVGCGNFKFHPIRLIATVLVAVISFSCLAVVLNIATADTVEAYAKAMYENLQYSIIDKIECYSPEGYHQNSLDGLLSGPAVFSREVPMTAADIKQIEDLSKTTLVKMQFRFGSELFEYQKHVAEDLNKIKKLFNAGDERCFGLVSDGFAVVDRQVCDKYGLSFVGRLPQNDTEVAINDCMLNMYLECGIMDDGEAFEINSAEDILGHKIPIEVGNSSITKSYTITAVVYTGCGNDCGHWDEKASWNHNTGYFAAPYYTDMTYFFHEKIFVHESFLPECSVALCPFPSDYDDFLNFTKYMVETFSTSKKDYQNQPVCYDFINRYSTQYVRFCSFSTETRRGFLYLSGIFFVISLLLLTNFIATLIRGQMKEIGILSSMGAGFQKTLFIYFLGALVPCLAVFLLSSIGMFGGVAWYNAWMSSEFELVFNLISVNPLFFLMLLALSVLTAFLGCLLPLLKMRKMSSAEIIRRGQIK